MHDLDQFATLQVLDLTTTGRITGLARTIEIWFVAHRDHLYMLAEARHQANWVKNIKTNPGVEVCLGAQHIRARGRALDPGLDAELWREVQDLAKEKYGWGDGLPVELTVLS